MIPHIALAVIAVVAVVFLTYRLGLFAGDGVQGRFSFLAGGVLMVMAAVWRVLEALSGYPGWFVPSAYSYIQTAWVIVLALGALLVVIGLAFYSDFWQTRRDDIETREQKLSMLNNLQHDSKTPYQLLELLNISLKEIVSTLPDVSGAVFLVNRSRRQFVLTAWAGLSKQETAALEYYPLERNIVSQAVDVGTPLIAGGFDFTNRDGTLTPSRFASCLVLPMTSGMEPVGGVILFSERVHHFSRADIKYLSPVADWLAEKIKSARLTRELSLSAAEAELHAKTQVELSSRLLAAAAAFAAADSIPSFCRSLVGLASSQSAHLMGLVNSSLHIYGGSEPLLELSENYRTALIDAIDRNKPLIVNQEAVNEGGRTFVAFSTLVHPCGQREARSALVLRKDASAFNVSEAELKMVEVFARLAASVVGQDDSQRLNLARRKGLQKVLDLLRFDGEVSFEKSPGFLVQHLAEVLPRKARAVTFARQPNGSFSAVDGFRVKDDDFREMEILPGEGEIGRIGENLACQFTTGRKKVGTKLLSYEGKNREALYRLFGEEGLPTFLAMCPIVCRDIPLGAAVIFMFDLSESEGGEWERLLTLSAGLYSVRLTIEKLYHDKLAVAGSGADPQAFGSVVNSINNHLSVVMGSAELARARPEISGEVRAHFQSILDEAEQAAHLLKATLGSASAAPAAGEAAGVAASNLNDIILATLGRGRISDNLYMLSGRTSEVELRLGPIAQAHLAGSTAERLAEDVISHFASLAQENDVLSVATYVREDYVYLDVSRHHKNFPPVERVAAFGNYEDSGEVLKKRPTDIFLRHLSGVESAFCYDRYGPAPSYLSFRFPLRAGDSESAVSGLRRRGRVLAIDDQPVILDLITAMCQPLGYDVHTAVSGEKGLELAAGMEFDVVLTDLAMPGMSGLEVARRIKRLHPTVPIILVTGWEVSVDRAQLTDCGIVEVLYKPFRIEQLTAIIKSVSLKKTVS